MSSFITGVTAWVVVFFCAVKLIEEPATAYWGGGFFLLCGFMLAVALSRVGRP